MKVWTFKITGGEPIQIGIPNSPVLNHVGRMTLWKMIGPDPWAVAVQEMLEAYGCTVERFTEEQTEEQEAERRKLLGREG